MATGPTATDWSPFVGRTAELAGLRQRIAAAAAGSGGLVLLSGPAGIGKTRTVEEATRDIAAVWGRSVDDPGAPPLWPWRRVLRARPEVGAAVADALSDVDLLRERSADPDAARFRFVTAATEALLDAAEPNGLVVVLEDLHWADETSLRLLRHLTGELDRSRLLVVGTYRDPGGEMASGRLDRSLPDLLRWPGTQSLALAPLTEDDVRDYLAAVAREPVGPASARQALRRSGGNPLYLRAVSRMPEAQRDGDGAADGELRHLVRITLATLDPSVTDLLATGAVLGEEIDPVVLAAVAGRSVDDVQPDLDVAVRVGVLAGVPRSPGRRRFVHAVVRDGIYADLEPSRREALHRRVAEAWEDSVGVDDSTAGVVAGHWLRAAAGPAELRRAAAWARRASSAATRSLAFDEAARFLGMARDALERAGADAEERAALLVDLAGAEFQAGRFTASLDQASAASTLARGSGRPDLLAAAALVVHDVELPDAVATQVLLCERALADPRIAADPALRARLLAQLASTLSDAGRLAAGAERSVEALILAEECGDPDAVIDAVRARVKSAPHALPATDRLRLGRLAVEQAAATDSPSAALWAHKLRIDAALEVGDLKSVAEDLAQVSDLAQTTRLPLVRWHDLRLRASVAVLSGRYGEALTLNDEAGEIGASALAQDPSTAGMSSAFRLQHALATGDLSVLTQAEFLTLDSAPDVPMVLLSRALVALLFGRTEEATAHHAELCVRLEDPDFAASSGVARSMVYLVEEFGDVETASRLAALIGATPFDVGGSGIYCCGSSASDLGRLAVVLGRLDEAVERLEEALAIDARVGARPAAVLDRVHLAGALVRRGNPGDPARALGLARQAAADARRLGMPGALRSADVLVGRATTATRAADPLTAREREIADLVAGALTNRQIADRLVLSERTVESHVRNILAKLGLANRTEIATVTASAQSSESTAR